MLRKDFGLEIKAIEGDGTIEGYASTFGGDPDSYGDVVVRGAFSETIAAHKAAGTMPLMLWGHQSFDPPIGNWTDMAEDRKGLRVFGQVDLEDPVGGRVHRAMMRKAVRTLSIGYETVESREDSKRKNVRYLEKVNLWEVSPVNFAANPNAVITAVKNIREGGMPSLPEFEAFLREAGFSKSEAAAIAGKGLAHLLRGEPGRDEAADFLSALKAGRTR